MKAFKNDKEKVLSLMDAISEDAYYRGVERASQRLEFWAAVVPETITKSQLLSAIQREAEALKKSFTRDNDGYYKRRVE